jgi:TonB-linked SusC/RagA family outer membrane protein
MKTNLFKHASYKPERRTRLVWLFSVLICFFSISVYAQEYQVTGNVTDVQGSPLPGINIVVKGTTTGTITDTDGNYSLNIGTESATIVFSSVGYLSQEFSAQSGQVVDIVLEEDVTGLEEIVVIGYGTRKKSLVTGAISSVEADEVTASVTRAELALQGKAAGVTVLPQSGSPGNGMKVRIRGAGSNGNAEPLYIVDGMKTGDINYLDPADIESMEVLKDGASAAIYGTEGANGVVMITTKSGKKGKSSVSYNFQYGIQSLGNTIEMMDAYQYATFMREAHDPATFTNVPDPANYAPGQGTKWLEESSENAPMQKHHLSFSGGNEKSTYLISAGYFSQDGIYGGDKASFKRISTRFNGTHQVKDWLEVGANVSYTNSKRSSITEDDGFNGIVNSAIMMDPTGKARYSESELTPYMQSSIDTYGELILQDEDGNWYGLSENDWLQGELINPLIRLATEKGQYTDDKIVSSGYVKLKPVKGLEVTSRIGLDLAYQTFNSWNPSYWANSRSTSTSPTVTINQNKWQTWLWENFATYSRSFGAHNASVMAGISSQEYNYYPLETRAGQMVKEDDQFRYPDYVTSSPNERTVTGYRETKRQASYFGRLSYDYDNKYLLEATIRRDGSSLFGPDYKWGNFPSVSAGWVFSNESFWTVEAINYAKVRASWGKNGSTANIPVEQYLALITTTNISYPDGLGNLVPGAEPARAANPELRWEASEQTNLGLDLRALGGRVNFTFDWYKKVTKDLLTRFSLAPSLGAEAPDGNAGEVTNTGIELAFGIREMSKEFTYEVTFNAAFLKNEVTYVNPLIPRFAGAGLPTLGTLTYFEKGQPIWYYRGYKTEGIFVDQAHIDAWKAENGVGDAYTPAPGDVIVSNVNGDDQINEEDMTNIGDPHPDFTYGINVNLGYKGFDLNVFMNGVAGVDNFIGFMRADNSMTNRMVEYADGRWIEGQDNTGASLPRADFNSEQYFKSDLMVKNGSYFKIRQIQLGYTLPENLLTYAKIENARVYFSLNDYFTFTKYPGLDPEVGSSNNNAQGIDFGIYPISKKILFGIQVTF